MYWIETTISSKEYCVTLPVGSSVVIRDSVAPGHKAKRESDTGASGEEEHTQTQQQCEEGGKQRAARNMKIIYFYSTHSI